MKKLRPIIARDADVLALVDWALSTASEQGSFMNVDAVGLALLELVDDLQSCPLEADNELHVLHDAQEFLQLVERTDQATWLTYVSGVLNRLHLVPEFRKDLTPPPTTTVTPPAQTRTARGSIPDDKHGTAYGYSYYRCRCDDCRAANAAACRERARRRRHKSCNTTPPACSPDSSDGPQNDSFLPALADVPSVPSL